MSVMSTPRFLADEDIRRAIVLAVRRLEPLVEFVRAQDVGLSGQPDPVVLRYAAAHDFVLVSHDAGTMTATANDFLRRGEHFNGLLIAPQSQPNRAMADELVMIWAASQAEEHHDRVQFLPL